MAVMDVFTRRIIGFGVERADIDGIAVCRMFNHAIAGQSLPKHVSTDHDPLIRFYRWVANPRVLEIEEVKSVPYVPVSRPFVERLIGTIRREYLDRILIWNTVDLTHKLSEFRVYYDEHRVHCSRDGTTPTQRAGQITTYRRLRWFVMPSSSIATACYRLHYSSLDYHLATHRFKRSAPGTQ